MTALAPAKAPTRSYPSDRPALAPTPLLPVGFQVPVSRWTHPSVRMRELLRTEPYLFGPGVYDPIGAQLVMYHGFKAVYFSGLLVRDRPPRHDRHGPLQRPGDRRRRPPHRQPPCASSS